MGGSARPRVHTRARDSRLPADQCLQPCDARIALSLAGAVFVGWTVNYWTEIPRVGPAVLQSFLAGGVLLNVLKEELPDERKSRY